MYSLCEIYSLEAWLMNSSMSFNFVLNFYFIWNKNHLLIGDLTDAKAKNKLYSQQYLDEWISYKKVTEYCTKQFNTVWLDVKGNHGLY